MPPNERDHLTLIGHSLGGRIVAKTVAELQRQGIRIQNACLLAAAIPFDDPDAEDEQIRQRYADTGNPPIRTSVAAAVREMVKGGA